MTTDKPTTVEPTDATTPDSFIVSPPKALASMKAGEVDKFADDIETRAKDKVKALRALAKALN